MSILTEEEFNAWLDDPAAIRGTIIEVECLVDGVETTRYLSTFTYVTSSVDTPANTSYDNIIIGGLKYTEKLSYNSGSAPLSVGDVELDNSNGEITSWLNDIWTNKKIKAYIGDPRWSRDSFVLIFDGIVSGIDSRSKSTINLKIRDKLQRLNTPIFEFKYADVAPYPNSSNVTPYTDPTDPNNTVADIFLPALFGECHNITPVLIDTGNLVYIANYGKTKGIIEVRDNGMPLAENCYEFDPIKGTIKMLLQPSGILTCSVQGDNEPQSWDHFPPGTTYRNTAASIIRRLVTGYGKTLPDPVTGMPTTTPSPDRFTDDDIDTDNFHQFNIDNPQPVGLYSVNRENLLSTCQELAYSIGAQIYMSRLGKLTITKLVSPPIGTPFIITEADMLFNSLQMSDRTTIIGAVKLGFTKNWTKQDNLLTNIPYEHKQLYGEDYSTIIKSDPIVVSQHSFNIYPTQENTYQITQPGAYAEADRRLNLFKNPHTVYSFSGFSNLLKLKLGQTVQLISDKYNLTEENGAGLGTIISLQPDWSTGKVQVGVFV